MTLPRAFLLLGLSFGRDPVSVHAATRCAHPHPTAVDQHDWQRRPGLLDAAAAAHRA